jgi:pyruvate/2-oxoglutarate/acetoin dehydrogenase E1 component
MTYKESITEAMNWLGQQEDTLFLGQTVRAGGSYMASTLAGVPDSKKLEWPVCENMQLGASLGLSLATGACIVSLYPRIDFLLYAADQLVNHLDKIGVMSDGKMKPRIIIRTSIGPKKPLDGGPQHTNNHGIAVSMMLKEIDVVFVGGLMSDTSSERVEIYEYDLDPPQESYRRAYEKGGIWLFIENGSLY